MSARCLLLAAAAFACFVFSSGALPVITLAALFLLAGQDLNRGNASFWRNPFLPASFILLLVLFSIGTGMHGGDIFQYRLRSTSKIVNY